LKYDDETEQGNLALYKPALWLIVHHFSVRLALLKSPHLAFSVYCGFLVDLTVMAILGIAL